MINKLKSYSDAELTAMLPGEKSKSEAAFTELYNRYSSMVHAYCFRVLNDNDQAEDVFQDTFIKFYQTLQQSPNSTNIPGFLITIARNQCLNIKRDKRSTVSLDDLEIFDEKRLSFESEELLNLITTALELLDFEYKEAFVMREYDGLSYNEIAEISGLTVTNAKSRVFRAKQKIKEILAPYIKEFI
jgi:RNA polymerase sigma-70 factor (ECF subfamily)